MEKGISMFKFFKSRKKAQYVDKKTMLIKEELDKASDLDDFLNNNINSMDHPSLGSFITTYLIEHKIEINEFVKKATYAGFVRQYVYDIINNNRKCSQDKLVAIALILGMNQDEANHMMQYAGINTLYVKNERDAILLYAINKNKSVADTNDLLMLHNHEPLELSRERKSK